MPTEILLYGPIFDFTAEMVIQQLDEAKDDDINVRFNTPGGNVFAGWGMIAKIKENLNKTIAKVDGAVMSMGSIMLPFFDEVEALDVSKIMIHRASGGDGSEEDNKMLTKMNKDLRRALEHKIDVDKFEQVTGKTFNDIFNGEEVVNVWLTGAEAKKVGLVDRVVKLTKKQATAFDNKYFNIAAKADDNEDKDKKPKKMTIEEIRAQHPEAYAQILALGTTKEADRNGAWMAFVEIDPKAVKEGIESGKPLSQTAMAEFSVKALNGKAIKDIEGDSPDAIATAEAARIAAEAEAAGGEGGEGEVPQFEASVKEILKNIK